MSDDVDQRCAALRAVVVALSASLESQGSAHRAEWIRQLRLLEHELRLFPFAANEVAEVLAVIDPRLSQARPALKAVETSQCDGKR